MNTLKAVGIVERRGQVSILVGYCIWLNAPLLLALFTIVISKAPLFLTQQGFYKLADYNYFGGWAYLMAFPAFVAGTLLLGRDRRTGQLVLLRTLPQSDEAVAGARIAVGLATLALGALSVALLRVLVGPLLVHERWLVLPAFVGAARLFVGLSLPYMVGVLVGATFGHTTRVIGAATIVYFVGAPLALWFVSAKLMADRRLADLNPSATVLLPVGGLSLAFIWWTQWRCAHREIA